jgi:hypothetical protein
MIRRMSNGAVVAMLAALFSHGCMKKTPPDAVPARSAVATLAAAPPSPTDDPNQAPEAREPKLSFDVGMGTTRVRLIEGEGAIVPGNFQNPTLSITVEPQRTFSYAGLRFDYPRSFTFEADLEATTSSWTLSGNDLKLMVFRFDERLTIEDYVKGLVERFGANTTTRPLQLRLGGVDYTGARLDVRLVQTDLTHEVVELPPYDGKYRILSIQDTKKAATAAEGVYARALLARTFRAEK